MKDKEQCRECNGFGVDPEPIAVCCAQSEFECGGRGCTGPDADQQPCRRCGGEGYVPARDVAAA